MLHVRRQFTRLGEYAPPKTKAAIRRIPLSEEMTRELAALRLRSRYSNDDDPVFAARNGKPLQHRNATRRGFELAAAKVETNASRALVNRSTVPSSPLQAPSAPASHTGRSSAQEQS